MNYQKEIKEISGRLIDLVLLFHGPYRIGYSITKEKRTNLQRYLILKLIQRNKLMNITSISNCLDIKKNTLSELINRMVNDKLLKRSFSEKDRRKVFFSLTDFGEENIKGFEKNYEKKLLGFIEKIKPEDSQELIDLFKQMISLSKKINRIMEKK